MLKIKDNVDLKELEKYGFKYCDNECCCYGVPHYETKNNSGVYIPLEKTGLFECREFACSGVEWDLNYIDDVVYDLIKADLVEKVKE